LARGVLTTSADIQMQDAFLWPTVGVVAAAATTVLLGLLLARIFLAGLLTRPTSLDTDEKPSTVVAVESETLRKLDAAVLERDKFVSGTEGGEPLWPPRKNTLMCELWLSHVAVLRRMESSAAITRAESLTIRSLILTFLHTLPRLVASACGDGQARIFDVRTGRRLTSVRHDVSARKPVTALCLSGEHLLTGSWDGRWHRWNPPQGVQCRPREFARGEVAHTNSVTGLAMSRDQRTLACACSAGVLLFRADCPTKRVVVADSVQLKTLSAAMTVGESGTLQVTATLESGGAKLEPEDELLSEAGFEGQSSRDDFKKLPLPVSLHFRFRGCLTRGRPSSWRKLHHDGPVLSLTLSSEGTEEFLYTGANDRAVRKWRLSGDCVHKYEGHTSMVRCLAVSSFLASGGDDRTVRLWDKATPTVIGVLVGHDDFVRAVALCWTFSTRLVSAGDDRRVILWDTVSCHPLREFSHESPVMAVALQGSVLFTASDRFLRMWCAETASLEWKQRHPSDVTAICLS